MKRPGSWNDTVSKWERERETESDLAFSNFHELPPYWSTGSYSASITSCKVWELELEKQLWRKISLILCGYNSHLPQNQSRKVCIMWFRNDCKQTSLPFCLSISLISSGDSDLESRKICGLQVEIEFELPFLGRKFSHWWWWRLSFFSDITRCLLLRSYRPLVGNCWVHFQGKKVSKAWPIDLALCGIKFKKDFSPFPFC